MEGRKTSKNCVIERVIIVGNWSRIHFRIVALRDNDAGVFFSNSCFL